jgi:hypothetical protein
MYFTQYVTVKIAKMSIVLFAIRVHINLDMHFEREFLQQLRYEKKMKIVRGYGYLQQYLTRNFVASMLD